VRTGVEGGVCRWCGGWELARKLFLAGGGWGVMGVRTDLRGDEFRIRSSEFRMTGRRGGGRERNDHFGRRVGINLDRFGSILSAFGRDFGVFLMRFLNVLRCIFLVFACFFRGFAMTAQRSHENMIRTTG